MVSMRIDYQCGSFSPGYVKLLRAYADQLCSAYFIRRLEGFIHNLNGPLQILWLRSEQIEKEIGGFRGMVDQTAKEGYDALSRRLGERVDSFVKAFRQLDDSLKFVTKDGVSRCRRGPEALSMHDVLSDVLFLMRADMFFKHQVEVNLVSEDKPAQVYAQHHYLCALFLSLIQNGLEAMVNSDVRRLLIEVNASEDKVVTHVRDTGCGVDERHIDRLFDLFFTTKNGQEYNGELIKHDGLGLPLVSVLASDYKGTIAFETSGDNTTFSIELPAYPMPTR